MTAIPMCDLVPSVSAPPDRYDSTRAIGRGNEGVAELAQMWAGTRPGFQGLWIDRAQHDGWITLAFTGDDEARQAEVETEFPSTAVVVVGVDWTTAELQTLQGRVTDELAAPIVWGAGTFLNKGVVGIYMGVMKPERVAAVEQHFAGERVCAEGIDPADAPAEGPQQVAGDGWRLLGDEATGPAYRTGYAADQPSYEALWQETELTGPPPVVDFGSEIAIWFGAVYGSSCPNIRLDQVVFDLTNGVVYPEIVLVDPPAMCTADANGHAYMVAVDRRRLPQGPFWIQLSKQFVDGPAQQKIRVDRDLSIGDGTHPSATPSAGAILSTTASGRQYCFMGCLASFIIEHGSWIPPSDWRPDGTEPQFSTVTREVTGPAVGAPATLAPGTYTFGLGISEYSDIPTPGAIALTRSAVLCTRQVTIPGGTSAIDVEADFGEFCQINVALDGVPLAVDCSGLQVPPIRTDGVDAVESGIDADHGIMDIYIYGEGDDSTKLVIRYNDQACQDHAGLGQIIRNAFAGETWPPPTPPPPVNLVGRLAGTDFAGACSGILADGQMWELGWPSGYHVDDHEHPRLIGPGGSVVAVEGDLIGLRGEAPASYGTFCMMGPVFHATEVVFVEPATP